MLVYEMQSTSLWKDDADQLKKPLKILRESSHSHDLTYCPQTRLLLAAHPHFCRRMTFSAACQGGAKHRSEDIYLHLIQWEHFWWGITEQGPGSSTVILSSRTERKWPTMLIQYLMKHIYYIKKMFLNIPSKTAYSKQKVMPPSVAPVYSTIQLCGHALRAGAL